MSVPTIAPGTTKVGWIGTGVMGQSMVGHLIDAGFGKLFELVPPPQQFWRRILRTKEFVWMRFKGHRRRFRT